jgi:hypothetical protein
VSPCRDVRHDVDSGAKSYSLAFPQAPAKEQSRTAIAHKLLYAIISFIIHILQLVRTSMPDFHMATSGQAAKPIIFGIVFLIVAQAIVFFFPMWIAAPVLGVLVSAAVCYVILVAMPRATQVSLMGAAIGVSADASYAKLNDQTPVTIANGLVKLADALTKSVGLVAAVHR